MTMAVNKPAGDNARKGAVKKRTQDCGDGKAGSAKKFKGVRREIRAPSEI
jgi:hypothetical protein